MNLSIVIPAYNEGERLPPNLKKINSWLKKQPGEGEIVVVDDGSTDNMLRKIRRLKPDINNLEIISYRENRGKGYALRKGMLVAKGDIIIFSDADLSTPIQEAQKLIDEIRKGVNVAFGSRFVKGSKVLKTASWFRNQLARIFFWAVRFLLFYGPKDTQCGFKGFCKKAAKEIFSDIKSDGVLFDLEIFLLAKKKGLSIKEVPVTWKHDERSKLIYNFRKSAAVWLELFRIKYLYKVVFPLKITT